MSINNENNRKMSSAKEKREVVRCLFMILQVGISMMVPLALGGILGYFIGKWTGLGFLILIGLALGAAAGYRNVYEMLKKYTKNPTVNSNSRYISEAEKKRMEAELEFARWKEEREFHGEEDEE